MKGGITCSSMEKSNSMGGRLWKQAGESEQQGNSLPCSLWPPRRGPHWCGVYAIVGRQANAL